MRSPAQFWSKVVIAGKDPLLGEPVRGVKCNRVYHRT
jgi:hypothetical protein